MTMARKSTSTALTTAASTAVQPWEAEMENDAKIAAAAEAASRGGKFFSVRAGVLTWQQQPLPGNMMGVIVLTSQFENAFYEGEFDPAVISPPTCYALNKDMKLLAPHPEVVAAGQAQHETCAGCPQNAWGSADKGRGKACGNRRRIGVIPAGTMKENGQFVPFTKTQDILDGELGWLKPAPTSAGLFSTFVTSLASTLKKPTYGIYTRVKVVPDPKAQFLVKFEAMQEVPDNLMAAVRQRVQEAREAENFTYPLERAEVEPAKEVTPNKMTRRGGGAKR